MPFTAATLLAPPCRVDLVLVGAEGIVENGGVINKLGTYQASLHCCFVFLRAWQVWWWRMPCGSDQGEKTLL